MLKKPTHRLIKNRGFTLIEVMIALLIIGVTAGAAYQVVGQQARVAIVLNERFRAQILTWNEAVLLSFRPPQSLSDAKKLENILNEDWTVQQNVEKTLSESINKVTFQAYTGDNQSGSYRLSIFINRAGVDGDSN